VFICHIGIDGVAIYDRPGGVRHVVPSVSTTVTKATRRYVVAAVYGMLLVTASILIAGPRRFQFLVTVPLKATELVPGARGRGQVSAHYILH
jgi:hypothetical protein